MRACPQCGFSCDKEHKFCPSCGFPIGQIARDTDDPLIGRTLPGGYVILELVGVGGMGRVYRAEQTNLGRTVAVKIVHPHLMGEESAVARFVTEARAASRLNHPNSVGVIDFGKTQDEQFYLVMEFLRGRDLARVVYDNGPLPMTRIIDVLRQTLAALGEAHALEIIHRDLKPENIIVEPMRAGGDFVKVVDFGLAKMKVGAAPSITSPGIVCGTPEYMSPEQGRGDPIDARSDLYAMGVILFQLLTGRLPFEADSPTHVVLMHISKPPPDPRSVAPARNIPPVLVDVLMKALSKEPDNRYGSADAFSTALLEAQMALEGVPSRRSTESAVRCPRCGVMNALSQKFCGECGGPLSLGLGTTGPLSGPAAAGSVVAERVRRTESEGGMPVSSPSAERRLSFPLPLVGRDDDLAWLEDRRNEARTSLATARIVGDAGMGKSRLLREFLLTSSASGDTVVVTGPDPAWAEVGYSALRRAIRSLSGIPQSGGTQRDWTGASMEARQGISDIFNVEEASGRGARLSPDERRFAAAEALRWAIVRAHERGNTRDNGSRVILAIDDLHAIDGASRNAFIDVISEPPLAPILICGAHPPEYNFEWPGGGAPRVLAGLPGAVVAKLMSKSGTPSVPSLSGGRGIAPLYVEQLLRFTREHGGGAPARLADIITLRVERLPADARRLLQAIAIVGDNATASTLEPLLLNEVAIEQALMPLRKGALIEDEGDDVAYRVSHPLIREVVLATIPAAVRKELHQRAADANEARQGPLEVRAMHELQAQNAFEALILLERVSTQAAARGDMQGNIMALRRGLELARRELFRGELDDPMRAVLIFGRKLGEALAVAGAYLDADGVLREALDMAGPSGQDRARVLGALAHVAHGRERRKEAEAYLREALELANRSKSFDLISSLEDLKRSLAS
jgi:serine/threonine protein kinase/tetratricopeptide (TPR) repeat protein